ncbi:MAG: glycosyltransferase [Dolichospermum sp. BR01]|nr:glycosyltransferase [Dolichospermum sp. BR01]
MRVLSLCFSDLNGGAARAAYRLHKALLAAEVDARMKVWSKLSDDFTVERPDSKLGKGLATIRPAIGQLVKGNFRTSNPVRHSSAWLPSGLLKSLNNSTADILHLHWLGCETLTIREIGLLRKPVVWTFHDMWAFCGAEHYTDDAPHARWRKKYTSENRPEDESGFDLNAWTWNRKQRYWKHPFHIVCPSHWLADCVRESALMRDWPVYVIPYALDLTCFRPMEKNLARQLLNLPQNRKLILFGAMGGGQDPRKGSDLLLHSLSLLKSQLWQDEEHNKNQDIELIIFGQSRPLEVPQLGFPIRYIGHLHDEISLALLYSAVDVFIAPSRQDNLPNTVVEASACGTPTVAFKVGGIPDLIKHQVSGYLAQPYDTADLAQGIKWVLEQQMQSNHLGLAARHHAEKICNPMAIAQQYLLVYHKALENHQ